MHMCDAWSILKVKHLHCFVFGGCDQDVVAKLNHRAHEILVLCVHWEEVICWRLELTNRFFQFIRATARTTTFTLGLLFLIIVGFRASRAHVSIQIIGLFLLFFYWRVRSCWIQSTLFGFCSVSFWRRFVAFLIALFLEVRTFIGIIFVTRVILLTDAKLAGVVLLFLFFLSNHWCFKVRVGLWFKSFWFLLSIRLLSVWFLLSMWLWGFGFRHWASCLG